MRYVNSCYKQQTNEEIYRIYVTDFLSGVGHLEHRYYDIINNPIADNSNVAEETSEEVISRMRDKIERIGRR